MSQRARAPVLGVSPLSDPARRGKQGSPFPPRQPGHCPKLRLCALWRHWFAPKADNRSSGPFPATSPTLTLEMARGRDRQTEVEEMIFNPLHPDTTFPPTFTPVPNIFQASPAPHPQLNLPTLRNPLRHRGGAGETPKPGGKARADKKEAREGGKTPERGRPRGKEKRLLTVGSHPWKHEAGRRVLI